MERVTFLVEDSGERIECLLNPETVVLRRKAGIVRYPTLSLEPEGAIEDLVVRVGGGATEIELELLFDIQIAPQPVGVEDVRSLTSKLWELTEFDGEERRAPVVRMFWGKVFSMRVVFAAVAERLDAINASGAARRSWLSARLIRVPDPPRRTTEDVVANPRPTEASGEVATDATQSGDGVVAGERADAVPDAEELERRAAEESGLWDWVRELVSEAAGDAQADDETADVDGDATANGSLVDGAGETDQASAEPNGAVTAADAVTADVAAEPAAAGTGAPGVGVPAASGAASRGGVAASGSASVGRGDAGSISPRAGTSATVTPGREASARARTSTVTTTHTTTTTTRTVTTTESETPRDEHGPIYRLLVATPQQAAHRLFDAIRSLVGSHSRGDTDSEPPVPAASRPASRAEEAVSERLQNACNEPSRVTEQFERYAQALERQATAAIRRAQEEHSRALERVTRQGVAPLQRLAERGEALQQQAAEQQRALLRQNEAHLNALTQNLNGFMDRSSKSFQEALAAQNKATDQLLTQIGETWQRGDRERARQLEQLLDKQRALVQACDASSVAANREPRTAQLTEVLAALQKTQPLAEPASQAGLVELLSAVLVFHASLSQVLTPVLEVLRDRNATPEARQRAHAAALRAVDAEVGERGGGRAEQWTGALKPPAPTATRLDILAAARKGNPASWRDVVNAVPGRTLV